MPMQPPRFSFRPAQPRKAWAKRSLFDDDRKRTRGRAWMKTRAYVLAQQPLCAECDRNGRTTAAEEVDHILPLSQGGTDEIGNLQGLCKPCHKAKTARESRAGRG